MNSVRQINIKSPAYYLFNGIINIKKFDLNSIVIDKKSFKSVFIYFICYVATNSVNNILYFVTKDANE